MAAASSRQDESRRIRLLRSSTYPDGRLQIYYDRRDQWIGRYVTPDTVYVCPLPTAVFRWTRKVAS